MIEFELDGQPVAVDVDRRTSLLETLRDRLGVTSAKDGCSPQGQCGCCTVLVDGAPRVACVTPVGRVVGRTVTTVDGLPDAAAWADAFTATGASQCGFCTPGIICRLAGLEPDRRGDRAAVDRALLAHLCRCTGWQTIREAAALMSGRGDGADGADGAGTVGDADDGVDRAVMAPGRDLAAAARRAELEGGVPQRVGPEVALGRGGFADDEAPMGSPVALRSLDGVWHVGATAAEARGRAGLVQGRRTTAPPDWPIDLPAGDWVDVLRTTWTEPAYLEPDASWCRPGGEPASPTGNGGAFGGKATSEVAAVARRLADEHGTPVRVRSTREDTVRHGPKRPPVAIGRRADGSGLVRVARPADPEEAGEVALLVAGAVARAGLDPDRWAVELVDVTGPAVSLRLRGAVWAEVAAVLAVDAGHVTGPDGARAGARIDAGGGIRVTVRAGDPLDRVVLRSYAIGAAHMALGMVRSESIAVDATSGEPLDLTIRSFGVLRSVDTPEIVVEIDEAEEAEPVGASDAVFAAVLGAAWRSVGSPPTVPVL